MTTDASDTGQTPRWVGVMIAVTLLTALVVGGGWWGWSMYAGPNEAELTPVRPAFGGRQGGAPRQVMPVIGVRRLSDDNYEIRGPESVMIASRASGSSDWTLRLQYNKPDLIPPEHSAALVARFRLTNDAAFAKSLKITEEQINQLRQVPPGSGMVVSDADMAKLKTLWAAYIASPQPDAANAVTQALQEVAQSSLDPTRAAIAERVKKVESILTAEQIAPFKR